MAKRFVRLYVQREARFGRSTFIHPLPARAAHALAFEFGDLTKIQPFGGAPLRTNEPAMLVGLQTAQRKQLVIRGNVEHFVVLFQPAAIYHLFGLPAGEIVDGDFAVHGVIGGVASELHQQLGNAHTFEERVQIADRFIARISIGAPTSDPIESAAAELMRVHGVCRIDVLATATGLSIRSFQRVFQQKLGVSPKRYARIVRFEAALKAKAVLPGTTWTAVAHKFGYHDQMHMIHDFESLSGETPTGLLGQLESVLRPQIQPAAQENPDLLTY